MSPPVLVIVTANGCATCKLFKEKFNSGSAYKSYFESIGLCRVIEINLESTHSPLPSDFPQGIKRYLFTVPAFILINGDDWMAAKNNRHACLRGDYMRMTNEESLQRDRLKAWIIETSPHLLKK